AACRNGASSSARIIAPASDSTFVVSQSRPFTPSSIHSPTDSMRPATGKQPQADVFGNVELFHPFFGHRIVLQGNTQKDCLRMLAQNHRYGRKKKIIAHVAAKAARVDDDRRVF